MFRSLASCPSHISGAHCYYRHTGIVRSLFIESASIHTNKHSYCLQQLSESQHSFPSARIHQTCKPTTYTSCSKAADTMTVTTEADTVDVDSVVPTIQLEATATLQQESSQNQNELTGQKQRKGIKLDSIPNIRDLSEACPFIQPGKVVRCASPADATTEDVNHLLNTLHIKDLLDLRSAEELQEHLATSKLFACVSTFIGYPRNWFGQISLSNYNPQRSGRTGPILHHQVSLLERSRYYTTLLRHLPWQVTSWALALALTGQKEASRQTLLKEINKGLGLLYCMLVDSARPEIVTGLRLVIRALENDRPVLLFCKAGKDRTGIMAALLLHCAGATQDQIIEDYHRSDEFHKMALAGIENKEELKGLDRSVFERAPREAMASLLQYLHQHHGDISTYLVHCGFTEREQARLKELLTRPRQLDVASRN